LPLLVAVMVRGSPGGGARWGLRWGGGSGGDADLGAGDVRADRGDHVVAEPVVFGVGVLGPVELGVGPVVGDGEVPPALA